MTSSQISKAEEKSGSDRIMTLPSGRKVVLKDIDLQTLTELHEIKVAGVQALRRNTLSFLEARGVIGEDLPFAVGGDGDDVAQRKPSENVSALANLFHTPSMMSDCPALHRPINSEVRKAMSNYLAGLNPQNLYDNTRTVMEEAVGDPIMSAAEKMEVRQALDVVGTHFGRLSSKPAINPHDFELPTPTTEQLKSEGYLDPTERNRRNQLVMARGKIRADLRIKGMDDNHIDRLFAGLAKNGVNLLNFNMDDLTITLTPAAPTVFDGALESFNKKAKKHGKKIKQ